MRNHIKLADIYCRLSDEEKKHKNESESITNQRAIIRDYCEKHDIIIVKEFVDDGYSGGNFERPGFQAMLDHLSTGKANMVITKDLSRLGRDMTESSYYAERFFPENGIHYLAPGNDFDSMGDNLMAPFQFAMNDEYLRDTSRKVKQTLDMKRKKGKYAACPPYGYKKAEKIIAVSELLAEKLKKYRPQYAEKIIAVNNLIDIERIKRMSAEEPETKFPKERFNIVSCGRLSEAKGMDIAVSACGELVSAGFTNIRWWIVGGGPEEDALREQIAKLHLEEYVMLLGMRSNPYPYIRMADLYVQPSRFEGHCVTVMEARILAKPILATKNAAREQIKNGCDGMLCDTDASSIAGGIRVLIEHSELREKFKKALEHQDFDAANERIMQRLYSLF